MTNQTIKTLMVLNIVFVALGCSQGDGSGPAGRMMDWHTELKIVDPALTGSSVSSSSVSAMVNVGSVYLESTLGPLQLSGSAVQASDVNMRELDAYISYSTKDTATSVIKRGAIEHVKPYNCDNVFTLLYTEHCLRSVGYMEFPETDIFASHSDGNNLYAVGSTLNESAAPSYGRLYKISLDSAKKPLAVTNTVNLPSYAGTSVTVVGTKVLATSGTSTDSSRMGGLSIFNLADLSLVKTHALYDARSVGVYGGSPSKAYVATGKFDSGNLGTLVEYNTDGSGSALRTIASGGNSIPESKSSVQVGNTLLLASLGDQGFKVLCKATGNSLASIPAVTVTGIPAANTVTNSVVAAPGYIFAANGEAGVYVYSFKKSSVFNSSYCQGVSVTLLGRFSLDTTAAYIPAELSANSVYYVPSYNLLNILTGKLLVIASGNGGVSLLNISNLVLNNLDVDDF